MDKQLFSQQLIGWYQRHHRDLPWRRTKNPYCIWLSEIILQQTRVKQGLPYYLRFVEAFPTVQSLANAEERDVLRLWQGLGYYSRARNLHQTAKLVANEHRGVFPGRYAELLMLKGVGTYTAAAIASFAFNEKKAVLDGNVFRVLARVFGVETDIASNEGKQVFSRLATDLLPDALTDVYNQAIMEFGAVQCTPATPDCLFCPLNRDCQANLTGRQHRLPVKKKKGNVRERYFHYLVLRQGDAVHLKERPEKDIWRGLYDFYLKEAPAMRTLDDLAGEEDVKELLAAAVVEKESAVFTHVLTHQRIRAKFWHLRLPPGASPAVAGPLRFYSPQEINALPKPILIANYLNRPFF